MMFREPSCNILLTYEKSTKKAAIFIENAQKKSTVNKYYSPARASIIHSISLFE